jgi:hypothetical protein
MRLDMARLNVRSWNAETLRCGQMRNRVGTASAEQATTNPVTTAYAYISELICLLQ